MAVWLLNYSPAWASTRTSTSQFELVREHVAEYGAETMATRAKYLNSMAKITEQWKEAIGQQEKVPGMVMDEEARGRDLSSP